MRLSSLRASFCLCALACGVCAALTMQRSVRQLDSAGGGQVQPARDAGQPWSALPALLQRRKRAPKGGRIGSKGGGPTGIGGKRTGAKQESDALGNDGATPALTAGLPLLLLLGWLTLAWSV